MDNALNTANTLTKAQAQAEQYDEMKTWESLSPEEQSKVIEIKTLSI